MSRRLNRKYLPALLLVLLFVLGVCAVVGGVMFYRSSSHDPSAQSADSALSSSRSQPVFSPPPSTSAPAAGDGQDAHAPIGANAFRYVNDSFVIDASLCTMPYQLPLNPPSGNNRQVCWVSGSFGQPPSPQQPATTYFLGHAWAQAPMILNPVSEAAAAQADFAHPTEVTGTDGAPVTRVPTTALKGDEITVSTPEGPAHYVVDEAWLVPKNHAAADPDVMDQNRPGRIVMITCAVGNGQDLDYNVIVSARVLHPDEPKDEPKDEPTA